MNYPNDNKQQKCDLYKDTYYIHRSCGAPYFELWILVRGGIDVLFMSMFHESYIILTFSLYKGLNFFQKRAILHKYVVSIWE